MSIGSMLGDIVNSFFKKPVTEKYPFEKREAPKDFRGKVIWHPETCTGCTLCVKDCPANALELFTIDKANKKFVMLYRVDRCTYCAQCVASCRFNSIELSDNIWELASTNRDPFEVYYGRDEDVKFILDGIAQGEADAAGGEKKEA